MMLHSLALSQAACPLVHAARARRSRRAPAAAANAAHQQATGVQVSAEALSPPQPAPRAEHKWLAAQRAIFGACLFARSSSYC